MQFESSRFSSVCNYLSLLVFANVVGVFQFGFFEMRRTMKCKKRQEKTKSKPGFCSNIDTWFVVYKYSYVFFSMNASNFSSGSLC